MKWGLLTMAFVGVADASLVFNNVTYKTANGLQTLHAFTTASFDATVVHVPFAPLCHPVGTLPTFPTRVLYLVDWNDAFNNAGCQTYETLIATLPPNALPLFYGKRDNLYDAAGPFVLVGHVADALAIERQGGNALRDAIQSTGPPIVRVTQEPGVWNELVISTAWTAIKWIFIAALALLDAFALYRFATLAKALVLRHTEAETLMEQLRLLWRDHFCKLYLLQLYVITSAMIMPYDNTSSVSIRVLGIFSWTLNAMTLCAFYFAFGTLVFKIRGLQRYKVFMAITGLILVLAVVGFILATLGTLVVSLFQLRSLGLILSIPVTTSLLFVQQLFFLVLAVGFIQFLHRHNISLSIIKQFKRMLYIGVVFIFALLLQVLVSVVYLVAYSVQHYLIVIIVGRASFALVQFCILKLPNTADIGWTPREDVQVHATRPFTVQGHRTILNWLKTTFMEQEDSEDLGLVHMGDSSGTAELSIVHN